ncbi:hypothetical protein [Clostridium oryzae]|uniref:Uncharacterized protein n=1 Tax=Clostridium oryzae TaxID=1450648 RepID=A0A1V4IJV6_9CLOT|nr:hypothetical protein [Clostridium oryzae]OPJ60114.1 hypothetical protein CLORY_29770 [Clostridium oryzae]
MSYRKVIENYYTDMNNLVDILTKLINSYRLLIGGVNELNSVALVHRKDIEDGIDRTNELGKIIDEIIGALDKSSCGYIDYFKLKAEFIKQNVGLEYIENEIDSELKLHE